MVPPRLGIFVAVAWCALACGDRPEPPGPAVSNGGQSSGESPIGAGSTAGSLDSPDDDDDDVGTPDAMQPEAPAVDVTPPPGVSADGGATPAIPAAGDDDVPPAAAIGQAAFGCTENGGSCLIFNIAVADTVADSCVQLALDNCESGAQAGLPIDLPVSWRLGAASVSRTSEGCVPGAPYDPRTTSTIVSATGSINWNEDTRVPSEVVLDLTLQPGSAALDTAPIRITNSDLDDSVIECD